MRRIALLGATGSIGMQTLDVVRACLPDAKIEVLTAGTNVKNLIPLIDEFMPSMVCIADEKKADELKGVKCEVFAGKDGLDFVAANSKADVVVNALVGRAGLSPTLAAVNAGKDIALANKETLVAAGSLVMTFANEKGVRITPIDSEHSAILQCLQGEKLENVEKIILTASGGPFRTWSSERIMGATAKDALTHPNWEMGPKITIDSATLMNKGLEFIEAMWLFDKTPDEIEIVIHPQSIIHSMVQFIDGSVSAVMGLPDMRLPILYALTGPDRVKAPYPRTVFKNLKDLTFEEPNYYNFPCLNLAIEAAKKGGIHPAVLNYVNEWAVGQFLQGKMGFYDISNTISDALAKTPDRQITSIDDLLWAEDLANEFVSNLTTNH